ncbi:MAG: RDD family protein [Sinobacteraceae bacterium]|nr:RDD family protein [Nevskiaceae bacterium]
MNMLDKPMRLLSAVLCALLIGMACAQEPDSGDARPPAGTAAGQDWDAKAAPHHRHTHGGDNVVTIGHNAELAADRHAEAVVAVFGSATSAGQVDSSVVAVFGDTHVSGSVGDGVVAVLGDNYINGTVSGDVVSVMGDVELGPEAEIKGDVVVVGGTLTRDPAATVAGDIQTILSGTLTHVHWLRPWVRHCLLFGRPLAFSSDVGWAWFLALGFLALYLFLALAFRAPLERSVQTLETHFGQVVLAAFLTILLTPVAVVLLTITVVGIAAVPFLLLLLFCAALFGKAAMLAALGRRMVRSSPDAHNHLLLCVGVGGVLVLLLYTVPVIGFIVFSVLGLLALGAVICTLLVSARAARQSRAANAGASMRAAVPPELGSTTPEDLPEPPGSGGGAASTAAHADAPTAGTGGSEASHAMAGIAPATHPYAGFWIRMAALLIDALLVSIVLHTFSHSKDFSLVILAGYGAVMWKMKSATIGGIIFGCQVVRADGRALDWTTAIVRALACFLSLIVIGLGFIWIAIDEDRQAWHDKIAGTVVVRPPKGASLL